MTKVLVIAPDRKTRGGITTVIKSYEKMELWQKWNCYWIGTYVDKNSALKIFYFLKGFFLFLFLLPQCKLVHIHLSEPISAIRKSIFFYIAKLFHKPIILHFHAFSPKTTILGKRKNLYKNLFQRADIIIVLSAFWKDQINELINFPNKIKVVYNPCSVVENRFSYNKKKYILYAGTLNQRKGYVDLITACSKIFSNFSDWKLILAGNGEIKKGLALAKQLDISNQLVFTDWVSGKEKEKLFQQASIFCLPSYAEGFPMAVIDAWSYGLPVVTTSVGGLPDILKHGENAMVFNSGDINALTENLEELMKNVKLREKLSQASLHLSHGLFNIEIISKQLDELYSSL